MTKYCCKVWIKESNKPQELSEKEWLSFDDSLLHREDGPACEFAGGRKVWYQNGEYHRENGPAYEWADGTKEWYQNGKRHRVDGPAREWVDGSKEWFQNGERHRVHGPACEWADGKKEYWLNGIQVTEKEILEKQMDKSINILEIPSDRLRMRGDNLTLLALYQNNSADDAAQVAAVYKDERGEVDIVYLSLDGHFHYTNEEAVEDVVLKPKKLSGWVNIYEQKITSQVYPSKKEADKCAYEDRLACIDLSQFEEGHNL